MTYFELNTICIEYLVSPDLIWENENFRQLVKNDNLTKETLTNILENEY